MSIFFNDRAKRQACGTRPDAAPLAFHRRLPSYAPTPLLDLPELAEALGLGALLVKDESERFDLPAFKVLGSSWAIYRLVTEIMQAEPEPWSELEELADRLEPLLPLRLVAATDGNHGRSVARVASWLGFDARIFVPEGTAAPRISAIESEGAEVTVVDGSYDEAVALAAGLQDERSILVQDSAWPGYEVLPRWIVEGYSTLFHEIDRQLADRRAGGPEIVMVQIGVGSLAAAAINHYRAVDSSPLPLIVGVEPLDAACAMKSLEKGEPVIVPGPHRSMMAGLNCGTLSSVAWPLLLAGLDVAVAASEEQAAEAVRILADFGISAGESGAAGLAGLLELLGGPRAAEIGGKRVLLLATEGVTDADNFSRIIEAS